MYNQPVKIALTLLVWVIGIVVCFSQSIYTPFGKNRVQYHDDFDAKWKYETQNYITYWYGKSKNVALTTMNLAESDHNDVQKVLEHKINDKIEILVYTDISDVQQSNIGNEEVLLTNDRTTKVIGNKMLVYFDGNHQHLRKQIKIGTAKVYFNNMMYGTAFQELLNNSSIIQIPEWFSEGVTHYAASPWDTDIENEFYDIWQRSQKFHDFNRLSEAFPRVAGHSFWYFIDQTYGKSNIPNILYLAKINKGSIDAFEFILGVSIPDLMAEWKQFYLDYFINENRSYPSLAAIPLKKSVKEKFITKLSVNPDGNLLAYATNDFGKITLVLKDITSNKEVKLLNLGYKNMMQETDINYPVISWSSDGKFLFYVYEKYNKLYLHKYNPLTSENELQELPEDFQRVYSISSFDGETFVFSANQSGYSDLYNYTSKNRNHHPILQNSYDKLDAEMAMYKNTKGIVFASNLTSTIIAQNVNDTLPHTENFDIFFMQDQGKPLIQLTKTPDVNETSPKIIQDDLYYLSDENGRKNLVKLNLISGQKTYVTDAPASIEDYTIDQKNGGFLTYQKSEYSQIFQISNIDTIQLNKPVSSAFITNHTSNFTNKQQKPNLIQNDTMRVGYYFQSKYGTPEPIQPLAFKPKNTETQPFIDLNIFKEKEDIAPQEILNSRITPIHIPFSIIDISTKLDNKVLFEGLESYTSDRPQLLTSPLGILLKGTATDLYEDYKVEVGLRIPTTFNGSEIYAVYNNNRRRIDKRIAAYRKTITYNNDILPNTNLPSKTNKRTLLGLYQWKYPFNIYRSVKATTSLRHDRYQLQSSDPLSFQTGVTNEQRVSLKLEYVFDNSYEESINMRVGLRYKAFSEIINHFELLVTDGFSFKPSKGFTTVLGFDARYYQPFLRRSILALRIAGATSFGSEKILYYLGGVENSFFQQFDNSISIQTDNTYAYKVNAYQMRGFKNNIRNGNTFLLSNIEARIPVMQYFLGKNRGSSFVKHIQIVGFYDAGLAWYGSSPYSDKNPLNQVHIVSPPLLELDVTYFRDPLVMSYGFGVRTMLLGYFIKIDRAWGIETRESLRPRWHFSFGTDF